MPQQAEEALRGSVPAATGYPIRFPDRQQQMSQDEEWFEAFIDGRWKRLRVHDYAELYSVSGLYEALVYEALKCHSPERITALLQQVLQDWPESTSDLRVLDLGAGNGIVAEHLRAAGVPYTLGIDLLEEAAMAANRDRPDAYNDYVVCDLTAPDEVQDTLLRQRRLNCLVTVAALGFGDIPPEAFANAANYIRNPGWIAMCIKEDFLTGADDSGFSRLLRRMIFRGIVEVQAQYRYCHRLSMSGEKLFYVGLVARKVRDIPDELVKRLDEPDESRDNGQILITDARTTR